MPKKKASTSSTRENRSDWVAVAPDASATTTATTAKEIRKPRSAYQFFLKEVSEAVKREIVQELGEFDLPMHGRRVRERWNALEDKEPYLTLARQDEFRYRQESHAADVAAIERRERLQRERNSAPFEMMLLQDDNHDNDVDGSGGMNQKRTTRRKFAKLQRKQERRQQKLQKKKQKKKKRANDDDDDSDFQEDNKKKPRKRKTNDEESDFEMEEEEESSGSWDSESSSSSQESTIGKKRNKASTNKTAKPLTQKQIERRNRMREEKQAKESYIESRQVDLRKEKALQAKRRLEFLLRQSNIFSHFGRVKEDTAKYGILKAATATTTTRAADSQPSSTSHDDAENQPVADDAMREPDSPTSRRATMRSAGTQLAQEDNVEEADEHEATFLTQQPTTLEHGQMRNYQLEGLNWMIRLQENGVNGILADEMGLGKTLQSIAMLVYMLEYKNVNGPHLIVVPKSTLSNWMTEISRWAPTLNAVKFHGDKETREDIVSTILQPGQIDEERDWHVVVTTYEVCNIEKNTLKKFAWSYLIIDEAHRLKNEASAFSRTVRLFETRYRILLTGTPLQNSLHELWALLNFLVPDVFESAEQFDEWFNLDIDDVDEKNNLISQLHKILRPFMLRRLKIDVEKSLPPKHETILYTGMSAMQKKLYRDILIRDIDAIQGNSGSRTAILNIVMQLRKAAGHPYLFPGVEDRSLPPLGEHLVENCGKMVLLDKLLKRLYEKGHRVLLFTQMTRILDILEDYLLMRRYKYCRIDGNTTYENRESFIEAYNSPDSDKFIFLLSTRAGGLGINLQTADIVILYDSDWNPQADLQAQDRAHRIGQKRPVQVFRFVTEHTIEEKIVERAQQKLKLDAMVVQSGRLKDKDSKLSREELLAAVRFGADKIFKSKDSSITDDDIDMILDVGAKKTQELNEKLQAADKGDLLDFKFDGSSFQTFDGVDYSNSALAKARAEAEMLGIFDIGKRERKEANYNENSLYQRQMDALKSSASKPKKKKMIKLPKHLRLPRMEEWQMYDRERLFKIQEEEELAFKQLPEELQKAATTKKETEVALQEGEMHSQTADESYDDQPEISVDLPPLLNDEMQAEKEKLLSEGFSAWNRQDYTLFVKASSKYGRHAIDKIALEVGKQESAVKEFAIAFWGEIGKSRIAEHEYDRVTKMIERGEKKIEETKNLERATRILVSHFENPWEELEFTYVNARDKIFTAEEDRYLLCWARKYGYGQWMAIKNAIRRNPSFRFDYFLRSLPVDLLARRCEQLMRHAEKEVEQLERFVREEAGISVESESEGGVVPSIELPTFRVLQRRRRIAQRIKREKEQKELEEKVAELEAQIKAAQDRLKELNEGTGVMSEQNFTEKDARRSRSRAASSTDETPAESKALENLSTKETENLNGAVGPDGVFVEFPPYDGSEPPVEWKKPFTQYCVRSRKEVKASLQAVERKNKDLIHKLLKEGWLALAEDKKEEFRVWTEWDKKRYARDSTIFENRKAADMEISSQEDDDMKAVHVPKKRKTKTDDAASIPKKKKKT